MTFVGWKFDANCPTLCEETLKNYGIINAGGRDNIFRLTYEVNGVLTNWGNNPRQNYYTFMDNTTSDPAKGCSTDNRLYYLEGTDLGGDAPVNNWRYTVTQVRPNDGQKYDGTTSY